MNDKLTLESKYQIYTRSLLTSFDFETIIALYQPILGYGPTNLYLTLWSEARINKANKNSNYLKRIIKLMNIDLRSLISYFSILEAIGLLKTYYNEDKDSYVFALVAPEKAHHFFQNPLLVTRLLDCLNEEDFFKTKNYFKKVEIDLDEYENITKNYKDVFSLSCATNPTQLEDDILSEEQAKITSDLDLELMKDALRQFDLHYLLLENRVCQTLEMLYLTYSITTDDLINAIIEVAEDDSLNLDELVEAVKLIDKLKKTPSKLELIFLRNNDGATLYEKYSVIDFLKKNYSYFKLSQSLYLQLETIMKTYNLSNGVMNIMLEVSVKQTESLNIKYLEAIAREWTNSKIDNVNKALERLKSIADNQKNKTRNNYNKQRSIGSTQDWNKVEEKELSEEELREMDDIIRKMKGE